jgi:hypothetical protein
VFDFTNGCEVFDGWKIGFCKGSTSKFGSRPKRRTLVGSVREQDAKKNTGN